MQKVYCYVDESGQDDRSQYFVVVAVLLNGNQDVVRERLLGVEQTAKTNRMKWHKTLHKRRIHYLHLVQQSKIAAGHVYFGKYKKPLPYFFPMIDVLKRAIQQKTDEKYSATVYVDGIDKSIAKKMTNALRSSGISLRMVRSTREESEPLIRLADMWAGCIRGALLRKEDSMRIFEEAQRTGYLREVT